MAAGVDYSAVSRSRKKPQVFESELHPRQRFDEVSTQVPEDSRVKSWPLNFGNTKTSYV